jgi:hypothetical protein
MLLDSPVGVGSGLGEGIERQAKGKVEHQTRKHE